MVAAIQFWTIYLVLVIVYQTTCEYLSSWFLFLLISHNNLVMLQEVLPLFKSFKVLSLSLSFFLNHYFLMVL